MTFESLGLAEPLLRAVRTAGYDATTPIQAEAIPDVLQGRDLLGCAQTGTGKTAAFALPTLHRLLASGRPHRPSGHKPRRDSQAPIRALVLAPTRELAAQIGASFDCYGKHTGLSQTVIYGGVSQVPQVRDLQAGTDILVATPGRLLDLMQQGYVDLSRVEILILDEADRMLDMGFIHDLRRIVAAVPRRRQTLMFSATIPDEIRQLTTQWLTDPQHVRIAPVESTSEQVNQSVVFVETPHKIAALAGLLRSTCQERTLVFARTKHGADKIVKQLLRAGIPAAAIHGNKSQSARQRALEQFKSPRPPVLIATDVAARGLHVDGISHVINYDLPDVPETYVHRIGRTGRAGASGVAISLCGRDERGHLQRIERLTRHPIRVVKDLPGLPSLGEGAAAGESARPAKHATTTARGSGGSRRSRGERPSTVARTRAAAVGRLIGRPADARSRRVSVICGLSERPGVWRKMCGQAACTRGWRIGIVFAGRLVERVCEAR